jgi:hypothetical protein
MTAGFSQSNGSEADWPSAREVKASHPAASINRVVLVMGLRYECVKRTPILHASSGEMNTASEN